VPILLLVVIFIAVPIAEIYVIIQVGEAIGPWLTVLLLAADSVIGSLLLRSQGRRVWARFRETLQRGELPHREVVDGVLVIFGGAFLITPGFLTDILGFLLLIPPTRSLFRRGLQRRLERRTAVSVRGRYPRAPRDYDVESTATEHDPPGPPSAELPPPARPRRPRA
jgi:UPF0716 protein FxsA